MAASALVVCGVDDSANGRQAIAVASAFADALDAALLPVHVLSDEPPFPYGDTPARERERRSAIQAVAQVVGQGPLAAERREELGIEIGRPAERLAAVARERGAEMLVVGSRGRGAMKRALLGSVTAELLGSAPCPVLAVPPDAVGRAATRWAPRPRQPSVVCGIDGSENALDAAKVASGLAARMEKRLVLVGAYRPDSANRGHAELLTHYPGLLWRERRVALKQLEAAEERLTKLPAPDLHVALGDPARAIRRVAGRERAELIVVGSRGRGAVKTALFGSVSGGLAASAPVPVLVVTS